MKHLYLMIIGLLISGMSFSQTTVKKVTVIIFLLLFSTNINAQALDNERVKSISQNWANTHNLNSEIANIICKTADDEPLLHIINFKEGWVMIAADESLKPVLGFSFDTNYSEENEPDAIKSLFEFYSLVKNENRANNIKFTTEWESIESGNLKTTNNIDEVEPLIPVLWAQDWPYNAYCPLDDDPDLPPSCNGHHNTSCGPTALAQVLRYWRYPVHGYGYHSYWYDRFDCLVEADFASTYYDWNNMPVSLDFDDPEPVYTDVATLMLHSAVSVDRAWDGGGAIYQYATAAVKYFGYSPTCEVYYRDDFTTEEWHSIFRQELDNGRPIMMAGLGHYFVCDGYYGDDFYHINLGWGGNSNGYYPLYELYTAPNWAIIGLEPNYQNKKLIINDPYSVDENTVVLLHFDGDLTNQSTLTNDPAAHGTTSFIDNSEMGLGQCLYLDNSSQGNQSFLDITDNNNLDLNNDWTIEMWFKPTSFGDDWYEKFTLLNKPGENDNFESNYSVFINPTSHYYIPKSLSCYFHPSGQPDDYETMMHTDMDFLELGNWYHISYTRNTSTNTIKLVIHNSDRELLHYSTQPTETTSQPLLNSNPLFIGSSNESNTYFDGYIDELRISNVVREFEITSTELTLLVPDGGECWQSGTTQQISWSCVNIENLKLEYSTNNGESWEIISNSVDASLGQYDWLIPNVISQQYLIKIIDISNDNTYKTSGSTFEVYDQLTLNLIAPDGGEYFQCESIIPIIWEMSGVNEVNIHYSTNNGLNWTQIVAGHSANNQPYLWSVPDVTSSNCKIKIEGNTISNESAGTFVILNTEIPGGPFAVDNNTVLLLSLDNSLVNKSELSSNAIANGDYSFSTNTLLGMGYCVNITEGSFLSVPHNNNLSLQDDWTIELWFNINSLNAVLINKPTVSWESNYNIHVEAPDGHMEARFFDLNSNRYQINTPAGTIEPNEWYHVAFINDASNNFIELIVRHEDFSIEFQYSLSYPSGTIPAISEFDLVIGDDVDGYIDEVRISNVVRSFEGLDISENNRDNLFSIYPNPSKKNVFISSPKAVNLSIYSLTGQKIWEEKNFLNGVIDVSGFKKGIYLVVFMDEKYMVSRKLIIE